MYVLPQSVKQDTTLSPRAKAVLFSLSSYCGHSNYCYPRVSTLAKDISQSHRTAQRGIAELRERGLVKQRLRPFHQSSIYTLVCLELREGTTRADRRRAEREQKKRGDNRDRSIEQNTSKKNGLSEQPKRYFPSGMSEEDKNLIMEIEAITLDDHSRGCFVNIVRTVDRDLIYRALGSVKIAIHEGAVSNLGAYFQGCINSEFRKASLTKTESQPVYNEPAYYQRYVEPPEEASKVRCSDEEALEAIKRIKEMLSKK